MNCIKFCFCCCLWLFLCVWNIFGTAEWICAKFTEKTCWVPCSYEVECQGQRSRSPGTKKEHFLALWWPACGLFSKTSLALVFFTGFFGKILKICPQNGLLYVSYSLICSWYRICAIVGWNVYCYNFSARSNNQPDLTCIYKQSLPSDGFSYQFTICVFGMGKQLSMGICTDWLWQLLSSRW